ncbi:tetratricopeptide repeat protein [Methylovulum psychrotolerans]|uniref:Secretory immunoglobulin A-binding protein EsiB n=1 Tax=Methylovulum psychrotolerans TaxID=1704499 RepID=A0A2S5CRG9_9GAMM|nr:tetratricopeptide repeat protein [Methylovulum psychrotolerans]POZ53388.1 Secretory immunoglobulin A-binding protein EsiB [Methylovulum psychrotolerans]
MKKSFWALVCIFAISGLTGCFPKNETHPNFADPMLDQAHNTQASLKITEAERDRIIKKTGSSESYYSKDCPIYLAFWQQAAQEGQAIAQGLLAGCYLNGQGVAKDKNQAAMWYRKAAEQGNADAQKNFKIISYAEAAEQGNAEAQYNLGMAYARNEVVNESDRYEAIAWFHKSASQRNVKAIFRLTKVYSSDHSLPGWPYQSKYWSDSLYWHQIADGQTGFLDISNCAYKNIPKIKKQWLAKHESLTRKNMYYWTAKLLDYCPTEISNAKKACNYLGITDEYCDKRIDFFTRGQLVLEKMSDDTNDIYFNDDNTIKKYQINYDVPRIADMPWYE